MAKRKNSQAENQPGIKLDEKTYQDFNNRKPSLSDPNERRNKLNPEDLEQPEHAGTSVPDEKTEVLKTVPGAPQSSKNKDR
jgi:hypothetical protein